ncbi:TonB family protein [Mesorhizobium sp. M0644]|uniref:cell envelope integrity protein TolA n=1 Tax=unclassified Mesorhizobium TaxID=325217 RepID=UPI0003CE3016|nr:energy transducer TonB [Mesorhizobium sp. LSJC280B00]ESW86107.1 biopolymer transporter TonB [Mesorhizobium sp. LSJC280B00]
MAWPLAGFLPPEPDDPDFAIPRGALRVSPRDRPEDSYIADADGDLTAVPMEPLRQARQTRRRRNWTVAIACSCAFHVAVALAFLTLPDDRPSIEGADQQGEMLLGADPQQAAGDVGDDPEVSNVTMVTMLDAKPVETVEAQAAAAEETLQPVTDAAETSDKEVVEPVNEAATETAAPADRTEPAPAQPARQDPSPDVLATDRLVSADDNAVPPPVSAAETAEAAETSAPAPADPAPAETVQTTETVGAAEEPKPDRPEPKQPKKATAKNKPARKAEPNEPEKPALRRKASKALAKADSKKKKTGSGGRHETDVARGMADGRKDGKILTASRGGKSGIGNAAVTNYPGKIRSKLVRAFNSTRTRATGTATVAFTVGSNGSVRSARLTGSSGVAALDKAALDAVRRASPFPPIPDGAGRSAWQFEVPLGIR